MPKIDWNRLQTVLVCVVLVLVLIVALGLALAQILHVLVLFALAAILALVLLPLVDWGEQHHMPRWLAVVATYLLFVVACTVGALLLFAPVAQQAVEFVNALPGYVASLSEQRPTVAQSPEGRLLADAVQSVRQEILNNLSVWSTQLVSALLSLLAGLGSALTDAVLILILSIYMLAGGRRIHASILGLLPARYRGHFLFMTGALAMVLGGYIRGQLALALLLGVAVTVGLALIGLPYALLLGLLATVLGIIPMIGSVLSAIPALLVALTQPWPTVLWVLIFFIVVQNVQDQVLAPRIQGRSVGLHPLAVMFALLAGAQLGGALGAIFALPIAALIWIVAVAIYRSLRGAPAPKAPADHAVTVNELPAPQAQIDVPQH
jgi:predicted PurR-regulated permease PerM